jgi:hypothetical protein
MGVPLAAPRAPTAGLANISPLPIEPPRTPRTIRGDGRVLIPRAVPAARNLTRRRTAPADRPRRVRRVGTGQTPPVCRRQQEGHPAAADHTPRTDLLTTGCPSAPGAQCDGRVDRRSAGRHGARRRWPSPRDPRGGWDGGTDRPLRRLKFSVLTFRLHNAYLRPGSGGGHGQGDTAGGSFRWPWPPGRGSHAGHGDLPPVRAPAVPAASLLTRVSCGSSRAAPGRSPAPDQRGDYLAVTGAVRAGQTGFAGFPAPPRDGQAHTMRNDNTTECAHVAIRRKVVPGDRGARAGQEISSGRGSRPGRACRTGGRPPARARPRRGTCRRSPGQPGAATGRTRSSACRAG